MNCQVEFHEIFLDEFETFEEEVQDSIFVRINLLSEFGFNLGRPYVDTADNRFKNHLVQLKKGKKK